MILSELKLSHREAARALNIDEEAIRRMCRGTKKVPHIVWLALEALRIRQETLPPSSQGRTKRNARRPFNR
jgi:hypothetical protein